MVRRPFFYWTLVGKIRFLKKVVSHPKVGIGGTTLLRNNLKIARKQSEDWYGAVQSNDFFYRTPNERDSLSLENERLSDGNDFLCFYSRRREWNFTTSRNFGGDVTVATGWRQEILAVALRIFGGGVSNFGGFGRHQNFFPWENLFLPVRKFISSREKIYFFQGENLFLPVKKFTGNREKIYGFTNSYLSTTYKRLFFSGITISQSNIAQIKI